MSLAQSGFPAFVKTIEQAKRELHEKMVTNPAEPHKIWSEIIFMDALKDSNATLEPDIIQIA
jgi:hypothetical protein